AVVDNAKTGGVSANPGAEAQSNFAADGKLTAHIPSVRKLAANFPALEQVLPHDPTTMAQLDSTAAWTLEDSALSVTNLSVQLDSTHLVGSLQHGARPQRTGAGGGVAV